jgi:hypothetical protein
MRSARFGLLLSLLLLILPVMAQQTQQSTTAPSAPKDPQAVSILNQALAVAGGTAAIKAITDYTSSGSITFHQIQDVQGTVVVRGLGLGEFRQDSTLPMGVRSFAISNGQATIKMENGFIRTLNFNYQLPLMKSSRFIPIWQLAAALNDPVFSLSYKGTAQMDGRTLHDVRIQLVLPGPPDPNGVIAEYFGIDFFIDPTTFQVVVTQDVVSPHFVRKIRYADYRPANGILVPFSIDEEIREQRTETIQLDQISLNTGLQDSVFELQ